MRDNIPTARLEDSPVPQPHHHAALAQLPRVTCVSPGLDAGHLTLELHGGEWVHLAPEHTARLALGAGWSRPS
jgi:hypothetical protein